MTAPHPGRNDADLTHDIVAMLVESSPDALIALASDDTILFWSKGAETIFGYTKEEAIGCALYDLVVPPELMKASRESTLEAIELGSTASESLRHRKDGSIVYVDITSKSVRGLDGELKFVAVSQKDVTQIKALRSQNQALEEQNHLIERASRMKSEFLANMSHELRTPLNGIIGFTELMHDGKVGPVAGNHKEYLKDILIGARHLLQLINDVLDLSKIEAGNMEFNPEPVVVATIVGEVCEIVRPLAADKRISIVREIDNSLNLVQADARSLKQILYNYLSNAMKFTPDEGVVTVRVKSYEADGFRIEVEDTGIGIRAEDIKRLFVKFQRLDPTTAKKTSGTGLGLALTKRFVEAQGGMVGVKSTPDKGSMFYAVLPQTFGFVGRIAAGAKTHRGVTKSERAV